MNRFAQRGAVLAIVAWAALAPATRADLIDRELIKRGPEILSALRAEGVKNVGVLKFRVQLPKSEPRFDVGRLGSLMETRLENVLILANDPKNLIGVTRGASARAAARAKKATYLTADGLAKLFTLEYPLAWGGKEVPVDAFLTGLVQASPDLQKITITLELYTKKGGKPKILEFTDPINPQKKESAIVVPTTRLLLVDMGRPFFLGKRELMKGVNFKRGNDEAAKSALAGGDTPPPGPKGEPAAENFDTLLDFRVLYDDKPALPDRAKRIPPPMPGQKVALSLKAKERIGLVVLVNGKNTLSMDEDRRDADQYSMWVLEPGVEYTISGYYRMQPADQPGKVRKAFAQAFKVATDSEEVLELADNTKAGKIELMVFREAPTDALPSVATRPPGGLGSMAAVGDDFDAIRGLVRKASGKGEKRSLVIADSQEKAVKLRTTSFEGVIAAHRTITYFTAPR